MLHTPLHLLTQVHHRLLKGVVNTDFSILLKKYAYYYNNGIDEVPGVVKNIAGNDIILLEIVMNDNSELRIKACTEDSLVTEFSKLSSGEKIDPTVTSPAMKTPFVQ